MKRVLYILQGIGIGGVSSVILNYYSLLSDSLAADFVVTVPYNYIPQDVRFELESKGCTIYHVTPFTKNMVKYRNDVKHIIKNGVKCPILSMRMAIMLVCLSIQMQLFTIVPRSLLNTYIWISHPCFWFLNQTR